MREVKSSGSVVPEDPVARLPGREVVLIRVRIAKTLLLIILKIPTMQPLDPRLLFLDVGFRRRSIPLANQAEIDLGVARENSREEATFPVVVVVEVVGEEGDPLMAELWVLRNDASKVSSFVETAPWSDMTDDSRAAGTTTAFEAVDEDLRK